MHEGLPQPVASIKPKNGQKISKNGQKIEKIDFSEDHNFLCKPFGRNR